MSVYTSKHKGVIQTFPGNGTHCVGGWQYYVANLPTGNLNPDGTPEYALYDVCTSAAMYSVDDSGANYSESLLTPNYYSLTSQNATLNGVITWSSNSILTQGRGDARYIQNGTLANVALSGNYNDLSNTPAAYSLPAATNTTLGGIIVGANLSISNGTLSANIPTNTGVTTAKAVAYSLIFGR